MELEIEKGNLIMDKIISVLRRPARLIVLISLGVYAFCQMLFGFGNMGDAPLGGFFYVLVLVLLVGGEIFAVAAKKNKAAVVIGSCLLAFYAISHLFGLAEVTFDTGLNSLNAYYVFTFMAGLALLLVAVLFVLGLFVEKLAGNPVVRTIGLIGMAAFVLLALIAGFIYFGVLGDMYGDHMVWYVVFSAIGSIAVLPAVLLGYILLCIPESGEQPKPEQQPEGEQQPEPQPEPQGEPEGEIGGGEGGNDEFGSM